MMPKPLVFQVPALVELVPVTETMLVSPQTLKSAGTPTVGIFLIVIKAESLTAGQGPLGFVVAIMVALPVLVSDAEGVYFVTMVLAVLNVPPPREDHVLKVPLVI